VKVRREEKLERLSLANVEGILGEIFGSTLQNSQERGRIQSNSIIDAGHAHSSPKHRDCGIEFGLKPFLVLRGKTDSVE